MVYFTIFGTVPRVTVSEYLPTRYVAYLWEAVNLDAAGLAVALSSVIGVSFDWLIFFLNLFSSFLYFLVFLSVSLYPNSIKIKIRSLLHIFQRFIVFLFLYFFSMFGVFEKYLTWFRENDRNGTGSDPIWPTDSTLGIGGTESTSNFKNFTFWFEATWGWNL